jgi:hypothetical protein
MVTSRRFVTGERLAHLLVIDKMSNVKYNKPLHYNLGIK